MQANQFNDHHSQPHIDDNQVRPVTPKDVQQVHDPAVLSYLQAHSFGIDPQTNRFF